LQTALLALGIVAIVAVFGFGWWQQRSFHRKFGAALKANQTEAVYQTPSTQNKNEPVQNTTPDQPEVEEGVLKEKPSTTLLDGMCASLNVQCDFIMEIQLVEACPAAALGGIWQRKFDFAKPVHVCGLTQNGQQWERAIAESPTLYSRFRIALQLVDRSGAVSVSKLTDFRDVVLGVVNQIKADVVVADVAEAHLRAIELDKLCAEVDQMIGINLVPPGVRQLPGSRIALAASLHGMSLEADGVFHLLDESGHGILSLINQNNKPFQQHNLDALSTPGITLLLDVPRVEKPVVQFDRMVRVAQELSKELQVNMVDDNRVVLSESGMERIREQVARIEAKMTYHGIEPGSAQARRLFS
jgi:FtsZ-interacting cell division protein ZipA